MAARWIVLIISIINPAFNYLLDLTPFAGSTMKEITDKYDTLFSPAGYAFSIWGIIYLSFIIYAIYQLRPAQRSNPLYDKVAPAFILSNLLGMAWQVAFRNDTITVSMGIIIAMLITAIVLYAFTRQAALRREVSHWVSVPFGLYLAWLSVATIANAGIWLASINWRGGGVTEAMWTNIMLGVALLLSIVLSRLFRDLSIPLVATWALIAIYVGNRYEHGTVATVALIAGLAGALWCLIFAIWNGTRSRRITDA